jgi:hypothetical protein
MDNRIKRGERRSDIFTELREKTCVDLNAPEDLT